MEEKNLRKLAREHGIDAIGWFKGEEFSKYLETIRRRKEEYDFEYKSYEEFIEAGKSAGKYKTIIVIIKDYFYERAVEGEGLKLSNYSRFCWKTVNAKAGKVIQYLRDMGYSAEEINAPDRAAACKAGLGFIGRNCMFYAYGFGSYVGIKTIGTNLELKTERIAGEQVKSEKCLSCNRCIRSCPTGAIVEGGYAIHPLKCISFINRHAEEPKKMIPDNMQKMNNWLHGCEVCQDCCPINKDITVHKKDVVYQESVNLYGMEVSNKSSVRIEELEAKIHDIKEPEYKLLVHRLITKERI